MTVPVTIKHEKELRLILFLNQLPFLFKGGQAVRYPKLGRTPWITYHLAISRQLS
jgi:hypothetical protein